MSALLASNPDNELDRVYDRRPYGSAKWANQWDEYSPPISGHDILSLWTADMDFRAPEPVVGRLIDAARHGIYGYTLRDPAHFQIVHDWFQSRHNWSPNVETMLPGPGIMPCVATILRNFTEPGDGVIVQTPVYSPYFEVVTGNARRLLVNELKLENSRYRIDFDHFETLARSGAKAVILCNPHNPSGYAWTLEELRTLDSLCERYGLFVISDEIHCDIRLSGAPHVVYSSVSEGALLRSFVCFAPTKTFNLAGLQCAVISVGNPQWREKLLAAMRFSFMTNPNYFSRLALEVAYQEGGPWLDSVTRYLRENLNLVIRFATDALPGIRPMHPDASFLLWMDARPVDERVGDVKEFFLRKSRVNLYSGRVYGPGGEGFIRLNFGCPRPVLHEALQRLASALREG